MNFGISSRWLCAILVVLAAAAWWNGLRAARDRHAMLQPTRLEAAIQLPRAELLELPLQRQRSLLLALPESAEPRRYVLHQVFPERRILRWLEAEPQRAPYLLLPLRGLEPGEYWLSQSDEEQRAAPEEMDRPRSAVDWLLRFRLSATAPASD